METIYGTKVSITLFSHTSDFTGKSTGITGEEHILAVGDLVNFVG